MCIKTKKKKKNSHLYLCRCIYCTSTLSSKIEIHLKRNQWSLLAIKLYILTSHINSKLQTHTNIQCHHLQQAEHQRPIVVTLRHQQVLIINLLESFFLEVTTENTPLAMTMKTVGSTITTYQSQKNWTSLINYLIMIPSLNSTHTPKMSWPKTCLSSKGYVSSKTNTTMLSITW